METPAPGTFDVTIGLRNMLSDAQPSKYVSLEAQLRRAVFERLVEQVEHEPKRSRRRRSLRRA